MEQAEEERDGERREETGRRKEAILPARLPGGYGQGRAPARGGDLDVFVHTAVRHVPPSAGFDGLSMMTEHIIRCNPSSGHVFVFCNDASSVVMEADLPDILRGHYRSGTHPNAVLGSFST